MEPRVSFLVTSYNKAAYLPTVLRSVSDECGRVGGEIILIDDGSTDGSAQICAQFAAGGAPVQYLQTENRGVFAAINQVLPLANAPWARMVDSDDPLVSGSTAAMLDIAWRHRVGFVFGRSIDYGPGPLSMAEVAERPFRPASETLLSDALAYLLLGMNFTSTCALYDRQALAACYPLPPGFLSCQDLAMAMRAAGTTRFVASEAAVCFYLRGVANQLIAREALTQHQTVALIREFWPRLPDSLRRKAASKLAMRARRWRNHENGKSYIDGAGLWLITRSMLARSGWAYGPKLLQKIEAVYEADLADLLQRRRRVY